MTIGEATKFTIAGSTTTPAAGDAVNLTITAKDVNNATVTTYTGSHSLVFSGAASSPGGNAPTVVSNAAPAPRSTSAPRPHSPSPAASPRVSSSKNGVLKIYEAGAASITATEGSLTTPTPLALTVSAVAATKFDARGRHGDPGRGGRRRPDDHRHDAYGNVATGYTGSKSLVFSGASSSPAGNAADGDRLQRHRRSPSAARPRSNSARASPTADDGDGGEIKIYKSGASIVKASRRLDGHHADRGDADRRRRER